MPSPSWLEDLLLAQERDSSLGGFRTAAQRGHIDFTFQPLPTGNLLLFRSKPVIPKERIPLIMREMHDNRGHFGQARTL